MTRRTAERLEIHLAVALAIADAGCRSMIRPCAMCQRWAWQEATGEDCPLEDFDDEESFLGETEYHDEEITWAPDAPERARA